MWPHWFDCRVVADFPQFACSLQGLADVSNFTGLQVQAARSVRQDSSMLARRGSTHSAHPHVDYRGGHKCGAHHIPSLQQALGALCGALGLPMQGT